MLKNIPYAMNLNPFKEIYQEKYPDISLKEIKEASKQEERGSSIASKKEVFRLNSNPSGLSGLSQGSRSKAQTGAFTSGGDNEKEEQRQPDTELIPEVEESCVLEQ
jgi:hypothetical protein